MHKIICYKNIELYIIESLNVIDYDQRKNMLSEMSYRINLHRFM